MADEDENTGALSTDENKGGENENKGALGGSPGDEDKGGKGGEDYSWMPDTFVKDGKPDYEGLAKSYGSLRTKMNDHITPESPEAYTMETKLDVDKDMQAEFRKGAHEADISQKQMDWVMGRWEEQVSSMIPDPSAVTSSLKAEWGENYDSHITDAKKAFGAYGNGLKLSSFEVSKDVLAFLARVGAELGEDKPGDGNGDGNGGEGASLSASEVETMMNGDGYWESKAQQAAVARFFRQGGKL